MIKDYPVMSCFFVLSPKASQLYYDVNTSIYYYYDAESGRYQFHSRIEVPVTQSCAEPWRDNNDADKQGRKFKKGTKKTSQHDDKVQVWFRSRTLNCLVLES